MAVSRNVMVIPARKRVGNNIADEKPKLHVAAYCRVSTDSDEQASSYEVQIEHYTEFIKKNPEWAFAGIFADDGISGTNTKRRDEFNRMIEECMAGNIDMVITKSISRFTRNTLDCLQYIRKLKEKNISVYFEKENINSLDSKEEIMLTIMASLAQEESRSISTNVTWGQRKRFADGKVSLPYKQFLGYELRELKQSTLAQKAERQGKRQRIAEMTEFLNEQSGELQEYEEQLVRKLIEKITVLNDKLTIELKSGVEINIDL